MKFSSILVGVTCLSTALAAPGSPVKRDDWDHKDYKKVDHKKHEWGHKKHEWGHKKGEWGHKKVDYHKGEWDHKDDDKEFTSTYSVVATPDQVVNTTETGEFVFTGGLTGALGHYELGLNSETNTICFEITLTGFRGRYESPADTATHIHEAPAGAAGPPRIAFPNPVRTGNGDERVSSGCLTGPFETGVIDEETGLDTGAGFEVSEIEANPAGFFADVHSSLAVPGAVRGQLA